ncbi:MAG TPA: hypothetical protein VJ719_07185 [Chthoniobacterales bacterium]|nr:hypothetical protein [Chthoniobacterales bacterium]
MGRLRCLVWLFAISLAAAAAAEDVIFTIDSIHDQHVIPAEVYGVNDAAIAEATVHRHALPEGTIFYRLRAQR